VLDDSHNTSFCLFIIIFSFNPVGRRGGLPLATSASLSISFLHNHMPHPPCATHRSSAPFLIRFELYCVVSLIRFFVIHLVKQNLSRYTLWERSTRVRITTLFVLCAEKALKNHLSHHFTRELHVTRETPCCKCSSTFIGVSTSKWVRSPLFSYYFTKLRFAALF
jgi:hypothetical protein